MGGSVGRLASFPLTTRKTSPALESVSPMVIVASSLGSLEQVTPSCGLILLARWWGLRTHEAPLAKGARRAGYLQPGRPSMQSRAALSDPREGRPGQAGRRPHCSSISRTKSRVALSALCLLSRQLLPRRGPFVDTVVRKSANVHLSGGPSGTP